jgi:hypothetical protein
VHSLVLTQFTRYEKAFVDFFEDELVRFGYDWKQVVEEYLFSGKEPVFNSVIADCKCPVQAWPYSLRIEITDMSSSGTSINSPRLRL